MRRVSKTGLTYGVVRPAPRALGRFMRLHHRLFFVAGSIVVFLIPIACKQQPGPARAVTKQPVAVSVKRYHLRGMVLAKRVQTSELTIQHGAIAGFMPAMTMV